MLEVRCAQTRLTPQWSKSTLSRVAPWLAVWPRALSMVLVGLATAGSSHAVEIRINCGSGPSDPAITDHLGRQWQADQAYADSAPPQYGYMGGQQESCALLPMLNGTQDAELYRAARSGFDEYRFDVPDGFYVVQLRYSDSCKHGRGQRVFDVLLQDETVQAGFDIVDEVGKDYAIDYAFPVWVSGGVLSVTVIPVVGAPLLSAVSVVSATPDSTAPAAPTGSAAVNGFHQNVLMWDSNVEPDLAGYFVFRANAPEGPFDYLFANVVRTARYLDGNVTVLEEYWYQTRAVDVWGNLSEPSATISAVSVDDSATPLTVYELFVDPDDIAILDVDPFTKDYVPASFAHAGVTHPGAEARYRGDISRNFSKKNWKIKLPSDGLFFGRRKLNLAALFDDWSVLRQELAFWVHGRVGTPVPSTEYVHLNVNNEFWGLYLDTEQVNQRFLEERGLDETGHIYKPEIGTLELLPDIEQVIPYYFEKETDESGGYCDLVNLIQTINYTSDDEFPVAMHQLLDVSEYLDYYATIILTGNPDFASHNFFLFHDLARDRWTVFPWDVQVGFDSQSPIDLGVEGQPDDSFGPNRLITRLMQVDAFRDYHCIRLDEWIADFFNPGMMDATVEALFGSVAFDARRDIRKLGAERNELFEAGRNIIKQVIADRGAFLLAEIDSFAPQAGPYLFVNEVMASNRATIADEWGEYDGWIEIYNAGVTAVDLSGLYLTDDVYDPTKYEIPSGASVPGGGHLMFWADNQPEQGGLHTSFELDAAGGVVGLIDRDGVSGISVIVYDAQSSGVSEGRMPDGSETWQGLATPSPETWNYLINRPPVISEVRHEPANPSDSDWVTVTCRLEDESAVAWGQLRVAVGTWSGDFTLIDDGAHGDGVAQDGVYGASIPPRPVGTRLDYFVIAADDGLLTALDPPQAPSATHSYTVGDVPPPLFINEFMADNDATVQDESGEYDDWLELHNAGGSPLDLSGMFLTDDLVDPTQWQVPPGVSIPAGGYLVLWADNDPEQGDLHTNFKLGAGGEEIGLFGTNGTSLIDSVVFGSQLTDISYGRFPDGTDSWGFMMPTPAATNAPHNIPPTIVGTTHTPAAPTAADPVWITSTVTDDGTVASVTLSYDAGGGTVDVAMFDDGSHGDGAAGDGVYGAEMPAFSQNTPVGYYVSATDDLAAEAKDPLGAPATTYSYVVGYAPPPVFINEFMADNDGVVSDEGGDFDDWFELYNAGGTPVNIGGMYLTDDLGDPTQWQVPAETTILAGEHLLFWADNDMGEGDRHTNFKLGAGGEEIGLYDTDTNGNAVVDTFVFGSQTTDVSMGRFPDGADCWRFFEASTPATSNGASGDSDGDGSADLADFADYPTCMSGPEAAAPSPACRAFDSDCDDDVDLEDFAELQIVLGTP
ncbi:MAG: hypothetical protein GY842_01420 [bacterium]|nr:hypothetical protein [bacterium]